MKTKADRATAAGGIERRIYPVRMEVRAQSEGSATVEGYASVTEQGYDMWDWYGSYTEVVRAGAFTKTLSENPQVQLLLNHGGLSMAYTRAGTLRLSEDSTGLHMGADLNTSRTDVADMVHALADGNVDEMSFAFRVPAPEPVVPGLRPARHHRGRPAPRRRLVVNFGANPAPASTMRAQDFDRLDEDAARQLYERLGRRLRPPSLSATWR
jgi:HK97 family phage prohead protease